MTLQVDKSSMEHSRGHISFTLKYNAHDTKLKVLIQSVSTIVQSKQMFCSTLVHTTEQKTFSCLKAS